MDSESGPGIFYNLGAKPGDQIHVTREDKTRVTFVVDKVAVYPKDDFPDRSGVPQRLRQSRDPPGHLRSPFDRDKGYLDNVVVFGHLAT